MIIVDPREDSKNENNLDCEVMLERSIDGQKNIKITIKSSGASKISIVEYLVGSMWTIKNTNGTPDAYYANNP